jgi:hypothetical protein
VLFFVEIFDWFAFLSVSAAAIFALASVFRRRRKDSILLAAAVILLFLPMLSHKLAYHEQATTQESIMGPVPSPEPRAVRVVFLIPRDIESWFMIAALIAIAGYALSRPWEKVPHPYKRLFTHSLTGIGFILVATFAAAIIYLANIRPDGSVAPWQSVLIEISSLLWCIAMFLLTVTTFLWYLAGRKTSAESEKEPEPDGTP